MAQQKKRNPLEKFLGLFTDVKAGEGYLALLFMVNVFLLLFAYYMLKPVRSGLINPVVLFGIPGPDLAAYLAAAMVFVLIPVLSLYGRLVSSLSRIKLLNATSTFIVGCVVVFFVLLKFFHVSGAAIAVAYFVWLGIVNVFIIAQFWSFANDVYTEKQGKRLFAIIAVGGSLGAILGSLVTQNFGKEYSHLLLIVAAGMLASCQFLYNVCGRRVDSVGTGDEEAKEGENKEEEPIGKGGGFGLVLRSKYLLPIALMIMIANTVNSSGEYVIARMAQQEAESLYPENMYTQEWVDEVGAGTVKVSAELKDEVRVIANADERKAAVKKWHGGYNTAFYGGFFFWVNLISTLLQLFVVSRIFKYLGVRVALFFLPIIATLGAAAFAVVGTMLVMRIWKTAENSTDYSLQSTIKQALFLPTTRAEKYKAKATIDTFFVRVGDVLAAVIVAVGVNFLSFEVRHFAITSAALGIVSIFLCMKIYREHKRLSTTE